MKKAVALGRNVKESDKGLSLGFLTALPPHTWNTQGARAVSFKRYTTAACTQHQVVHS